MTPMSAILAHAIPTSAIVMVLLSPLIVVGSFVGYWLAGRLLAKRHPEIQTRPAVLGATRTIVAVLTGYAVINSGLLGPWVQGVPLSFALPFIPLRAAEWMVLLWIWSGRRVGASGLSRLAVDMIWGTALSFVIDLGLPYWFLFSPYFSIWL